MTAAERIARLTLLCLDRHGVSIEIQGEKFALKPAGRIAGQIRQALTECRKEIRTLLLHRSTVAAQVPPFARGISWHRWIATRKTESFIDGRPEWAKPAAERKVCSYGFTRPAQPCKTCQGTAFVLSVGGTWHCAKCDPAARKHATTEHTLKAAS